MTARAQPMRGEAMHPAADAAAIPSRGAVRAPSAPSLVPGNVAWLRAEQPAYPQRIAVRAQARVVIVRVADIVRIDSEDNYVRLWADRPYLHKETLAALMARLDPACFLRIHRSHAVAIDAVRELHPGVHGEYVLVLSGGVRVASGRSYKAGIQRAFGLGHDAAPA